MWKGKHLVDRKIMHLSPSVGALRTIDTYSTTQFLPCAIVTENDVTTDMCTEESGGGHSILVRRINAKFSPLAYSSRSDF